MLFPFMLDIHFLHYNFYEREDCNVCLVFWKKNDLNVREHFNYDTTKVKKYGKWILWWDRKLISWPFLWNIIVHYGSINRRWYHVIETGQKV